MLFFLIRALLSVRATPFVAFYTELIYELIRYEKKWLKNILLRKKYEYLQLVVKKYVISKS